MRPVVPQRILFATILVALAAACDETPPGGGADRLFASAADARLVQGQSTKITVTSLTATGDPGEGSVTATIDPVAAAIAAEGSVPTEATASAALTGGIGVFDFRCAENPAQVDDVPVTISVSGPTGNATAIVTCTPRVEVRQIQVDTINCASQLQADGASSCTVTVTVRNEIGDPFEGAVLSVDVDSAILAAGGDGDADVLSATADGQATASLDNLTTNDAGIASFFIKSPGLNVVETVAFTVRDDAGNAREASVEIKTFEDKSNVTITAPDDISDGETTEVTISGFALNGTPAVGLTATVTFVDLTPTANACLSVSPGNNVVNFGTTGVCTFNVTAPSVDRTARNTSLTATFQAPGGPTPRTDTATIIVNPADVSIATPRFVGDRDEIFADREPSSTVIEVSVKKGGDPLAGAIVTATIDIAAAGVIRFVGANEDVATGTADATGLVTFTVTAENALALGQGEITFAATESNGTAISIISPAKLTLGVSRQPLLSSLVFDGFDPASVIGVPGGPLGSSTSVRFKLLDEANQPVKDKPVRFIAQSSVPGIRIIPFDVSDAAGIVTTVVTAGLVAGPITVVAVIDSPALSAVAPAVSVVGGVPNSAYSTLTCDAVAAQNTNTTCTVSLADKFTNVVETGLNVQFRAEGGSIVPSAEATGGTASVAYTAGSPGAGSADVSGWTYSPLRTPPSAVVAAFPGCFDRTTRTSCDLLALCSPAANDPNRAVFEAFCPLPPSSAGAGLCAADVSATARQALLDEQANASAWELELFTAIDALAAVDVDAQFAAYVSGQRACGVTLGCLTGDLDGLGLDPSDDCPVNPGCLDYSDATECPQNGLIDILAAVRGEEGYDDKNGNGVRDANEDFVDFPEPFLDKNSSCSFDDLNDNARLTASQKIQLSDLFIDSDSGDGEFGFNQNNVRKETNGSFDSDTEIFLKTSVIQIGAPKLQFGQVVSATDCGATGNTDAVCTDLATSRKGCSVDSDCGAGDTCTLNAALGVRTCTNTRLDSACTEIAVGGQALLEACTPQPQVFRDKSTVSFGFRWTDANGNCPTENFAGTPGIAIEGPAILVADDSAYSEGECGASPGGAGSKNLERPWCEEHPGMGAPIRTLSVVGDCGAEEGSQLIKLTFDLDGTTAVRSFSISCPVCGDSLKEGEEECDDGPAGSATCDATCAVIAP